MTQVQKNKSGLPEGWKEVKLGDYINIKHGYAFPGKNISNVENKNLLLTPGNFKVGGGFKYGKKFFDSSDYPKEYLLKSGDIVITMTDLSKEGDTLGYPALIPNNSKINFLHNQRVGLVEFKNEDIDNNYLYWRLRNYDYQKSIVNSSTGSTVRHTSPGRIGDFIFNLPPLPTQKSIAKVLSSFDDKIELLREQNETLEKIGQEIFKEWFGKYKVGDELPEGWRVGKISDLGKVICGKTPSKSNKDFFEGDIPFIKIPDMHNEVFISETIDSLTEEGGNIQKNKYIPENSICVSCIATVGLVGITTKKSQTNQQINSIIPNKSYYLEYLFFVLRIMKNELIGIGSGGSATLNINTTTFSNIKIIIPNSEILISFSEKVENIFEKIRENNKQIKVLSKTREVILPKLMKGEIKIV